MQSIPGFHVYPQGSRFSGECSSEVSIVAPFTLASVTIDLNATPVAGGSSSGSMRKRQREMPADMLTGACNLFDGMPTVVDDNTTNRFLENMILKGGASAAGAYSATVYDPDETQSQDDRAPFTQATNDQHEAFMQDQVGLDGFPLDHEFPEDYDLEEKDDDMDIDGEPLFEEELANQSVFGAKPKCKSKQMKAYMSTDDKLLWIDSEIQCLVESVPRHRRSQKCYRQDSLAPVPGSYPRAALSLGRMRASVVKLAEPAKLRQQ
ncbi:DNA repair protein rhp54 [Hordeum vulgare]|nr:DNA repair protein rhp54 [Hordeum vulgare]